MLDVGHPLSLLRLLVATCGPVLLVAGNIRKNLIDVIFDLGDGSNKSSKCTHSRERVVLPERVDMRKCHPHD